MASIQKGIFCIEGHWDHHNIEDQSTVLPILDILYKRGYCGYVHHDCATKSELEFYLQKWNNKTIMKKYPILYLAFHGAKGCVFLTQDETYTLDDLAMVLEGKCLGKVIYFGSCSTLNIDIRQIKRFLQKTKAIAAIGYKTDIDWIQSAACDLFVFEALQKDRLTTRGINAIYKKIVSDYGNLHKRLDLRIVINEE
jgi:hypothetical protein